MMFDPSFKGMPAIVLGTGPSLAGQIDLLIKARKENKIRIFGVNHTWQDLPVDVLICCDPAFHAHYGKIEGPFVQWYWDKGICDKHGYRYVEGVWLVDGKAYPRSEYITPPGLVGGLWLEDKTKISLNHCSSAQALNLAVHYDCEPILLVGHDFRYEAHQPRHYFSGLSDVAGEYPPALRKDSKFDKQGQGDDLMRVYQRIADQQGLPPIINCSPGSHLECFPMGNLEDYLG